MLVATLLFGGVNGCEHRDEDELSARVVTLLRRVRSIDAHRIEVSAEGTRVVLRGRVPTLLQKERAASIARVTPGVTEVVDRIELDPYERDDRTLERRVRRAMMLHGELNLDVQVKDGVAVLRGSVERPELASDARSIAASIRGVTAVEDRITGHFRVAVQRT